MTTIQQPSLVEVIEQAQIGLQKALFKYQVAQYHYAFAIAELDKYQDLYFKAKDKLYYITRGLENGSYKRTD